MTQLPALLTTEEAAAALRVHPETLRRWVREDKVPAVELPSGVLRFRLRDVEHMLGVTSPAATAPAPDREAGAAQPTFLGATIVVLVAVLAGLTMPAGVPIAVLVAGAAGWVLVGMMRGAIAAERGRRD